MKQKVIFSYLLLVGLCGISQASNTPTGYIKCAKENEICRFTGTRTVAFGAADSFIYRSFAESVACTNTAFGSDPKPGKRKYCSYSANTSATDTPDPSASSPTTGSNTSSGNSPTTCSAPAVKTSTPSLPGTPMSSDEYTPVVVAAYGAKDSLIAWKENGARRIQVGKLDSDDKTFTKMYESVGDEVHAIVGNTNGGAILAMVNDPDIYSSKYCYSARTPDKAICGRFELQRFNASGTALFTSTLTDKKNVDSNGALFVWWYGHTARLGYDAADNRYLAYFRSAGSYDRPNVAGEVDIHAGDTLRLIDGATGKRLPGGWDWGCSHSWSVRLALSGKRWNAMCHGDAYPNAMSSKQLDANASVVNTFEWLSNSDATRRALGGVVAVSDGFWVDYVGDSGGNLRLHLAKFDLNGKLVSDSIISSATNLDSTYPFRPYMAKRGNDLLLGWKSGGKLTLATASLSTGQVTYAPVTTSSRIDNYSEFVSMNNGDVIWANVATNNVVTVSRVQACQ